MNLRSYTTVLAALVMCPANLQAQLSTHALAAPEPSTGAPVVQTRDANRLPAGPGTFEIGLFAQYTRFDAEAGCPCFHPRNVWGPGGRLGVFATRTISVELDAVMAEPKAAITGEDMDYRTIALRVNYNLVPRFLPGPTSLITGVGPVLTQYRHADHKLDEWGVSVLAGVRILAFDPLALRLDGVADYMPDTKNLNLGGRLGLSLLLGGRRVEAPAPIDADQSAPLRPPPLRVPAEPVERPIIAAVDTSVFTEPIYFDFDRAEIRSDAAAVLERKAAWLRANPEVELRIEGHADARGSDEYNLALGQRRAAAARAYLVQRGIPLARFALLSFGEERPACTQAPMTEPCHQLNRRAEFRVTRVPAGALVPPRE